ncbi:hypothetical protein A2U01_0092033, partial [Trifolium medium]|nr:hypothetical protein [Trifolium medium]
MDGFEISGGEGYVSPKCFEREEVRRSIDVLEAKCSRPIDVVRGRMNLSNELWEPLKEKLLDQVIVMEASLRL